MMAFSAVTFSQLRSSREPLPLSNCQVIPWMNESTKTLRIADPCPDCRFEFHSNTICYGSSFVKDEQRFNVGFFPRVRLRCTTSKYHAGAFPPFLVSADQDSTTQQGSHRSEQETNSGIPIRILVGDIGGTNCRLQMIDVYYAAYESGDLFAPIKEETVNITFYKNESYDSLKNIVAEFIGITGHKVPAAAVLAVAGPVEEETRCLFTNGKWIKQNLVDGKELESELGIEAVTLLNDFVANGYGLESLMNEHKIVLQDAPGQLRGPIVVIGAGTGFGQVNLTHDGFEYKAFQSEGGHTDFGPNNEEQDGLLRYLRKKYGHVSVERIVSGPGLKNIYDYFADTYPDKVNRSTTAKMEQDDPPKVVAELGSKGSDELCERALRMFVQIYGAEAGNKALSFLPYGGLYIAGGIAIKILPMIQNDELFMCSFRDKGRLSKVLDNIPVVIVDHPELGLLGSKAFALRTLRRLRGKVQLSSR